MIRPSLVISSALLGVFSGSQLIACNAMTADADRANCTGSKCDSAATRLVIANSNVPNMVGQISTKLAAGGVNIADLLNKSRGEYAYTLIDADGSIDPATFAAVRGIHGVLAARLIKGEE